MAHAAPEREALALPGPALPTDRIRLTPTGLALAGDLSHDEWQAVGRTLHRLDGAIMWWLGDWWAYGEARPWGTGAAIAEAAGYAYQTARNAGWVAQAIELSRRRDNLTWGHHEAVAALPAAEQDALLDWCLDGPNGPHPLRELRHALIQRRRQQARAQAQAFPAGTFRVIYADPPWEYADERVGLTVRDAGGIDRASTAAAHHYPTMPTDDICALEVDALAQPNAVLFCWATFPLLADGLRVVDAWGFAYKTAFIWAKPRGSFGHYHKADAELVLVGTRGACTPDAEDTRVSQVIAAPAGPHSRKPVAVRSLIEALYQGPYLELFARTAEPGWQVWGTDV